MSDGNELFLYRGILVTCRHVMPTDKSDNKITEIKVCRFSVGIKIFIFDVGTHWNAYDEFVFPIYLVQ